MLYKLEYDRTEDPEWNERQGHPRIGFVYNHPEGLGKQCRNKVHEEFVTEYVNVAIAYQNEMSKYKVVKYTVKEINE